jgi:hypothetical protein
MALRFIAIDPGTDQGHCPADPHALHPSAGGCYAGDSRTSCAPSEAEPQERARSVLDSSLPAGNLSQQARRQYPVGGRDLGNWARGHER